MLKIGTFSKLSRISIRMLRHYDELGLLTPVMTDHLTAYRYYSADQLLIAARILELREMGFKLSAIREILQCYDNSQALAQFLSVRRAELMSEAQDVANRLRRLETAIERLRKDETSMSYNVTVKTMPQRYVASVRQIIPAYNQEGILWQTLCRETAALGVQMDETSSALAMFHDEGYKEGDVDVEVQMAVKGRYENTDHVVFKTVPAMEIASTTFKGSYAQLPAANQAVANWVQDNGYEFDGTMFLIYHVSPSETDNPEELVTESCFAVRKK